LLVVLIADFGTFTLVLVTGIVYLLVQHDLKVYEMVGTVLLLLLIGGLSGVLLLGLWKPTWLHSLLAWLQRLGDRAARWIRRPSFLAADWAERTAFEFTEAAAAIGDHPTRLVRTLGVALLMHLIDLISLYTLFLAFHGPVTIGLLVAGYAIGVLFWIIAITPQGIGVVEGVMALVYASLGIPGPTATIVVLAFRGLTFWLPMFLGFLLLRRIKAFAPQGRVRERIWTVHLVSLLTAVMGGINVLSAVRPHLGNRLIMLHRFLPIVARQGARLTAALLGFVLLMLAGNLWRSKRVAWVLALGALAVSAVSYLVKGLDYEGAILSAGLMVWLAFLRSHFHARSDPASAWQGVRALGAALLFTLAYGTAGFYVLDRHFSVNFGLGAALRQTVMMFTQFYDPGLEPITGLGRYFAWSIYAIGAATMLYALWMLLRPVLLRQPATATERQHARAIVESYGRSSLASCTLLSDKSYYFSPGGSLVAFVVKGRIALVLGDPIGPAHDIAAAIAGFQDYCAHNDWQPVFYQTMPDNLELYRADGFDVLCVGQEAIVDVASFTLSGTRHKSLRSALNRLTKMGYRAELHAPPLPDDLLAELRAVSDAWLTTMNGQEKGFSLGWFDDPYIRSSQVMAVHRPDGGVDAFANIVPEYQLNEATIDLMRHRGNAEKGVMDLIFISLFQWAKEQGYATFNLGLSALAGVGEHSEDPAIERTLHYIYEHVNQFYNFQGLHAFKHKFDPQWSPRYLVYPGPSRLPAVLMAMIRADSGDDFATAYLRELVKQLREKHSSVDEQNTTEAPGKI
jgi:phosphatidylglycerol lysyltransferase